MPFTLSMPNTSITPDQPGRWVVTEFGTPSVLKWETWDPTSELSGENVLVRIIVAGIAGADNIQRTGGYPVPQTSKPGFTPGYDCVGEVIALGDSMIGTCSPSKFDYVRSLGVEPIDRNASDLVEQVRALTGGEGVDVAYDAVCSEGSLQNSLAATKAEIGQVIVIGIMSEISADGSGIARSVKDTLALRLKERMRFFAIGQDHYQDGKWEPGTFLADFNIILEKVRSGELEPAIAKLFHLSEAIQAHDDLISGSVVKGKMLFIVDADVAAQYGL
ncbi:hypothetical protein B0J13DRAFT_516904 [Dactylonectria estremocensis]|uniref:Enoyl reductase (ER) domain-containing protein n=1 Tax=Dactylonectria estremocensis TaxID=1079267 RepID=A0A9P9CXT2_9HYPO|nr:hypothetical protein B0J13DRAFT_516904 [Dactylonectria estremocensis]